MLCTKRSEAQSVLPVREMYKGRIRIRVCLYRFDSLAWEFKEHELTIPEKSLALCLT